MQKLQQMVAELDRQKAAKLDAVIDTRMLKVTSCDQGFRLQADHEQAGEFIPTSGVVLTGTALQQVADNCSPVVQCKFLKELQAAGLGDTAADLVTKLIRREPSRRMIRLLDGRCRAYLSNKYCALDNHDLAATCLAAAEQAGGDVVSCSLSDALMRISFTGRNMQAEIAGRVVRPLVMVSNSEIGQGQHVVSVGLIPESGLTGAIVEKVVQRIHLGASLAEGLVVPDSIAIDAQAIRLKARDAVWSAFVPDVFLKIVQKAEAAENEAVESPKAAVKLIVKDFGLPLERQETILEYFLNEFGGDNAYGLALAVSKAAQDTDDADEAEAFQMTAGKIIEKPSIVRKAKKEAVATA